MKTNSKISFKFLKRWEGFIFDKYLLLMFLMFLLSCIDEGTIKLNSEYTTPNVLDYQHDFSKYPENFQIVTKIYKFDTFEDQYDNDGLKKPKPKRIPMYQIHYSNLRSPITTSQECTVPEYKKMKVQIGDVVLLVNNRKFASRMNPVILKSPVRVVYKPVEKVIDRYVFDNKENPEFRKVFADGKVIDYEAYRNNGIQGPIYIINRINHGVDEVATVYYYNEYGIYSTEEFINAAVTTENLKIGDIVELQWDGNKRMLKKLPMYAKHP